MDRLIMKLPWGIYRKICRLIYRGRRLEWEYAKFRMDIAVETHRLHLKAERDPETREELDSIHCYLWSESHMIQRWIENGDCYQLSVTDWMDYTAIHATAMAALWLEDEKQRQDYLDMLNAISRWQQYDQITGMIMNGCHKRWESRR